MKPFIHKFKTQKYYYVYDVNTNQIVRVDKCVYDIIDEAEMISSRDLIARFKIRHSPEKLKEALSSIDSCKSKMNLFSSSRPSRLCYPDSKEKVRERLENELIQLVLNVTEKCNLRCRYCVYSGEYKYERTHGDAEMRLSTAIRAVDFFVASSAGTETRHISFYGGEPLLNFDLIRKVIAYVKKRNIENVSYYLTTNGTLLSRRIISFLIDNRVLTTVSLDGPGEAHDRYRIFSGGKGTYNTVISNVKKIIEMSRQYFENCVTFCCTLGPPYENREIYDFFASHEPFEKKLLRVGRIKSQDTSLFEKYPRDRRISKEFNGILLKELIGMLAETADLPPPGYDFLKVFLGKPFQRLHQRSLTKLEDCIYPNGICLPGQKKLFVSPEGSFYTCEKIDYHFPIGNLSRGFDYEAVNRLIQKYCEISEAACIDCWALRICNLCFVAAQKGDKLSKRRKESRCRTVRAILRETLIHYALAREKNIDAFSTLADQRASQ